MFYINTIEILLKKPEFSQDFIILNLFGQSQVIN